LHFFPPMMNLKKALAKHADKIGIAGGTLCLIHCLAMPMLALVSSGVALGGHTHQHGWFPGDDYLFVLICAVTVFFAARSAHSRAVRLVMLVSAVVFSTSVLLGHLFHIHDPLVDYSGHVGALTLIGAHIANLKDAKNKRKCNLTENAAG